MSQIAGKWIKDGAITASKIDTSSTFTFQGLNITQDASIAGDFTLDGTMVLPNATVNKYLYVNSSHEIEYADASGGGGGGPHHVTIDTLPVAQDTTGWRNSGFSMSADDATAYINPERMIELNTDSRTKISLTNMVDNYYTKIESTVTCPPGDVGSDQTSSIIIEGSPYTSSSVTLRTGIDDTTHKATLVLDSGINKGSNDDRATIIMQTGDAALTLAQRNIYESSKYEVTVTGAKVYIDSNSGGYMVLHGGDTTMEGANKRLDLNGGANTEINLMGDAGAGYDGVNIVAGDASYGQIWMWGSANTSSGIEITLNTDAVEHPTSKISISGGANGGAKDVPIQILTDNNVTLGRASGNTNRGTLAGYFRQIDLRTTTSSMVLYGSDSNTVSAGGTLQLTGVPVKINTTGDAEVTGNMYVSGDIYSVQFVNYSSSSTVSGFTGTPSPLNIFFNKVGKQVDVYWNISGNSNSSAFCFTLPPSCKAAAGINFVSVCYAIDAGGDASAAMARILGSDSTVNIFPDIVGNNSFTSSGTKASAGHITYQSV